MQLEGNFDDQNIDSFSLFIVVFDMGRMCGYYIRVIFLLFKIATKDLKIYPVSELRK